MPFGDAFESQWLVDEGSRERAQEIWNLAAEYCESTERFDRRVCTGQIAPDGGIMPATPEERAAINLNAIATRKLIDAKAEAMGVLHAEMTQVICNYRDHAYRQRRK